MDHPDTADFRDSETGAAPKSLADHGMLHVRLRQIFDFLLAQRQYNAVTQHMSYVQNLRPWPDTGAKLRSLLFATAHTQTQPKLNELVHVWKGLEEQKAVFAAVTTLDQLVAAVQLLEKPAEQEAPPPKTRTSKQPQPEPILSPLNALWTSLNKAPGFGPKTAALFVKAIVDIHTQDINTALRFLDPFPIDPAERLRVPVDAVIRYIFQCLTGKNCNFEKINRLIVESGLHSEAYPTIWDDLWFWGFITQHGGGDKRKLAPNDAKFWSILGAPKDQWAQIAATAEDFIALVSPAA